MQQRGRAPAEHEFGLLDVAGELGVAERGIDVRRLFGSRHAIDRARRESSRSSCSTSARACVRIDVADDREHRVRRPVKVAVEAADHVARERAQSRLAADAPAPDAVLCRAAASNSVSVASGARAVGFALGFLDDDFEFARKLAGVDQRIRIRIGLNREARGETARREHRVVVRVVVDRAGVEISAARLRIARDFADAARRRALEVHVLEHVRDADFVVRLVEIAGLHVRHDRDDRRARVAPHEQAEAVRRASCARPSPAAARCRAIRCTERRGLLICASGRQRSKIRPSNPEPAPYASTCQSGAPRNGCACVEQRRASSRNQRRAEELRGDHEPASADPCSRRASACAEIANMNESGVSAASVLVSAPNPNPSPPMSANAMHARHRPSRCNDSCGMPDCPMRARTARARAQIAAPCTQNVCR